MFNLQGGELMIILLLALVVLGPEKLPEAMRKLGKMYGEVKRMSTGFQEEFRSAVDEPMREFRKAVDEPMNEIRGTANALRDSADFRRFEAGERTEKPKSGDMAAITESAALLHPADPHAVPVADTPSFQPVDGEDSPAGPLVDADVPPPPTDPAAAHAAAAAAGRAAAQEAGRAASHEAAAASAHAASNAAASREATAHVLDEVNDGTDHDLDGDTDDDTVHAADRAPETERGDAPDQSTGEKSGENE